MRSQIERCKLQRQNTHYQKIGKQKILRRYPNRRNKDRCGYKDYGAPSKCDNVA